MSSDSRCSNGLSLLKTRVSVLEQIWSRFSADQLENPVLLKYPLLATHVDDLCKLLNQCHIDDISITTDTNEVSNDKDNEKNIILENRTLLVLITAQAEKLVDDCSPLLDSLLILTKQLTSQNVDKEIYLKRFKRLYDHFNNIVQRLTLLVQKRMVLRSKIAREL